MITVSFAQGETIDRLMLVEKFVLLQYWNRLRYCNKIKSALDRFALKVPHLFSHIECESTEIA